MHIEHQSTRIQFHFKITADANDLSALHDELDWLRELACANDHSFYTIVTIIEEIIAARNAI